MALDMLMQPAYIRSRKQKYKGKQIHDIHPKFWKTGRSTSERITAT